MLSDLNCNLYQQRIVSRIVRVKLYNMKLWTMPLRGPLSFCSYSWDTGSNCTYWITVRNCSTVHTYTHKYIWIWPRVLSLRCALPRQQIQAWSEQYSGVFFSSGLMEVSTPAHWSEYCTILLPVTEQRGRRNSAWLNHNVGHSIYNRVERANSLSAVNLYASVRMTCLVIFEETDYREAEGELDSYCGKWKPPLESNAPESDLKYKLGQN